MSNGFWGKLQKPFFVLAPMADVTDAAFRRVIAKHGKPDVFWTEFVSVDGLLSPGREVLEHDLEYSEEERPIVAQIFGGNPEKFKEVAKLLVNMGFDGIDINMGCPDRNVEKQGGGSSLIKDPKRAQDIIAATKEGVQQAGSDIPVSVKTRIGYNKVEIEEWLPAIFQASPAVVTVHARTRKEMSKVPARWEYVRRAVQIRDAIAKEILIIGNGDVKNLDEAHQRVKETGADGVMIGRGIFGTPWLFDRSSHLHDESAVVERLHIMLEHTRLFEDLLGGIKHFAIMKKHYKAYVNGFEGAKDLRVALMETTSADEVERVVHAWLVNRRVH